MAEPSTVKAGSVDARRYFRRWARNEVNIPAKVEILTAAGKKFTEGTAVIRDVSMRGALLESIKLKKPYLPASFFRLRLTFSSAKYRGIGALCRPIRFGRGEEFQLAVEFEDFWAKASGKSRD
jgi:hypothetical protein